MEGLKDVWGMVKTLQVGRRGEGVELRLKGEGGTGL